MLFYFKLAALQLLKNLTEQTFDCKNMPFP